MCGDIIVDELGISAGTLSEALPALDVIDEKNTLLSAKRLCNSYKGLFGHVVVIGGDKGMSSAALLVVPNSIVGWRWCCQCFGAP
jgi:NAD(P)H-hydrate repair Nnr-like enzyme with NAD(P)H-hydrate dehydratase domain